MDDFLEFAGFALVIGFLWFVWPPLVLLGAGLFLVMRANTRTRSGRLGAALAASIAAGRRAMRTPVEIDGETRELRRVA